MCRISSATPSIFRLSVEDLRSIGDLTITKSVEDFKMEQQATASTTACSSCGSFSSQQHDSTCKLAQQAMDAQDQLLYPILGRPSNILNDYIVFPIVLGTGYYGTVRECRHRKTGLTYAVKTIEKAKIQRLDHLRREVDLLASMEHSALMRSVNVYEDMNYVHIVTQKCSGGELFDKIVERTTEEGCFEELSAARIIKSLLEAVAYLHANGIVHRDIKPENILFETQEEDSPIKLIDFGLSRRHVHGVEPNLSNPVGSAYYMSPECLECDYSAPTDIWSIGIITYILLCGYAPFSGDDNCEIFNAISIGNLDFPSSEWMTKSPLCIDFIKCLLRRDPTKRFTAQEALMHPWILEMTAQCMVII